MALKYYKKAVQLGGGSLAELAIGQLLHSNVDQEKKPLNG